MPNVVVVSEFVPVIGGSTSPGPLIWAVTPPVAPSCTVSYSFALARLSASRPHATAAATTSERISLVFIGWSFADDQSQAGCHVESIFVSQQDVLESFPKQQFMTLIGASLEHVGDGEVVIALPFRDDLVQQTGTIHAGVLASIADSACGYAALTKMPAGSNVLSVEFKINLLAPAIGDKLIAKARVVRAGKTLTTVTADVFADDTIVATMLATMIRR